MLTNSDHESGNEDVHVEGGTFDGNNILQTRAREVLVPGREQSWEVSYEQYYNGAMLQFRNVTGLSLRNVTLKDPNSFGLQLGDVHSFSVEDIIFDYNMATKCMDGVHVNGLCDHGVIRNVSGNTEDDEVALNAEDLPWAQLTQGPIHHITVDGVSATEGCRAVRILSNTSPVHDIEIRRVRGHFKHAVVLFSKHYGPGDGDIDNVTISDVKVVTHRPADEPLIYVGTNLKTVSIIGLERTRSGEGCPDTLRIWPGRTVGNLVLKDVTF
jgi:hypothetical protein